MTTVQDILTFMEGLAPYELAEAGTMSACCAAIVRRRSRACFVRSM